MPKTERRLAENPELAAGNVGIIYPELTFKDTLTFKKEKLVLVYTPGHTEDCISVHDEIDRVLYVGDNIEKPLPYLLSPNLDQYIKTLKYYKSLPFDKLICSHNGWIEAESIDFQIEYIENFKNGAHTRYSDELMDAIHNANLKNLKLLDK
jgi:glyoxylase-like metal-dependent hydrolase (beta-lactamase superfamily II)